MRTININKIKKLLKKGKMVLVPTVLAGSILFTGCGTKTNTDTKNISIENAKEIGLELDDTEYMLSGNKTHFINGSPIISSDTIAINTNIDLPYTFKKVCSVEEFGKYVGEENTTWEDINNTLDNVNIDNTIKEILRKGINNLQKNNFNMNLNVLNYNLKKLKIEFGDYGETLKGQFQQNTGKVLVNNSIVNTEKYENIIIHEILGHGMTMAYTDKDGGITTSPEMEIALVENDNIVYISALGSAFKEAIAQIITSKACNQKYTSEDTHYVVYVHYLDLLLNSLNIKEYDYASKGTKYLVDQMKKNGILDAVDYIHDIDCKMIYFESLDQFYSLTGDLDSLEVRYLTNIILNKYPETYDQSLITTFVNNCLNSSKNTIVCDNYEGFEGIVWSNGVEGEFINYEWIKENTLANFLNIDEQKSNQKILK